MTTIKRYGIKELTALCNELAYQELAWSTTRWENNQRAEEGKTLFRMDLEEGLTNCSIYRDRIENFLEKADDSSLTKDQKTIYLRAVDLLYKLSDDEELTTITYSKNLYDKEKNIYNSRFYLEFPLDKKLNALYDDLTFFCLRYCDISAIWNNKQTLIRTYKGNKRALEHFAELCWGSGANDDKTAFLALKNDEDRCAFLQDKFGTDYIDYFESLSDDEKLKYTKKHVEFTHAALGPVESSSWGIVLYGTVDPKFQNSTSSDQSALPKEFADFDNLTLAKTMEIKNNDLQQRLQTKIDIDKENLKVLDERVVRGDLYKILEAPSAFGNGRFKYIIRYVCPSTGRVYFNAIDERSLSESKYYKNGDVNSLIYAWWHVNNCGEDPMDEEAVIRC